jgi:hypothetical protein
VESLRFIRSGIAASALGHLSALALVLVFAEVHPFGSVTAEPITVDLVPAEDIPEKVPELPPAAKAQPSDAFDLSSTSAPAAQPVPAAPQTDATPPQEQAAPATTGPDRQQAAARPQPQPEPQRQPEPQSPTTSPLPAYIPAEPDLSLKYHVMLGLPPDLPHALPQNKPGDGFDAAASEKADVASSLVTEFRRHLQTCSKLPASIVPSDKIKIKLRVLMTPDGKLATTPVLIEASASAKGPALMQSAIGALEACQPYAMLPADRYGEWKVLDLSFTPQDFAGG